MNKKFLKLIIFAIPLFFVFFAAVDVFGASVADLPLPTGAAKAPAGSAVVQQIYYLFQFGLGAIGIVAFGSIIYGAVKYMAAAGDPSAITEAKGRIFSALWGIGIALTSIILLGTINPDLVNFLGTGQFNVPKAKYKISCGGEHAGSCAAGNYCSLGSDGKTYQCMTPENFALQIKSEQAKAEAEDKYRVLEGETTVQSGLEGNYLGY